MEGINGTLFVYGQTSSNKTYTIIGSVDAPGIIRYALDEVFYYISKTENREFLLRVSYMEIYNEIITDLLNPKSTNLKIRENVDTREISVENLSEKVVTSVTGVIDVMRFGEKNRHIGAHAIFKMVVESRDFHDVGVKVSHLNLVDLAGSFSGAEGIRLKEDFTNKSLFALRNVIIKLSEGENTFVPFCDSKLTCILQNSLGGNAKTSIICSVTTASTNETLSTLQFASRAKRIKNRPEVNVVLDDSTMLKRYRREINELERKLEKCYQMQENLLKMNRALQQLEALHATSDSENNNIFEQELLKYKPVNEALDTKIEAAVSVTDQAITKCQQEKVSVNAENGSSTSKAEQDVMSTIRLELVQLNKLHRASTVVQLFEKRETELHTGSTLSSKCQSGSRESPERKRKHSDDSTVVEDRMIAFPDAVGRKRLKDDKTDQI